MKSRIRWCAYCKARGAHTVSGCANAKAFLVKKGKHPEKLKNEDEWLEELQDAGANIDTSGGGGGGMGAGAGMGDFGGFGGGGYGDGGFGGDGGFF